MDRATEEIACQGRRSSSTVDNAASETTPLTSPVVVWVRIAPTPSLWALRTASAIDMVSGTVIVGLTKAITAQIRPPQAAANSPVSGLPVSFHTAALTTRPPSRGMPGSKLKAPTKMLVVANASRTSAINPVTSVANSSPSDPTPKAMEVSGPTTATMNS